MYKILIIEDNLQLAKSIKEYLGTKNYSINIECNGANGLKMAISQRFDLIILDIMLPEKTGYEISEVLRNHHKEVPILMMSQKNATDNIINGFSKGADDYLPKPFSIRELKARVDALLNRPPKTKKKIIQVKDLVFDLNTMTVMKNGKQLFFRRKELAVLRYFLENPEVIITKDQVINNVWPLNADPEPGILDVYLSRIRKKLGSSKSNPIIKTIHGIGFKVSLK